METATQRTQAHALIDILPQDSLEIVIALMRKLTSFNTPSVQVDSDLAITKSKIESLSKVRALAGCFSDCQSQDWKEEKIASLQEKYHS